MTSTSAASNPCHGGRGGGGGERLRSRAGSEADEAILSQLGQNIDFSKQFKNLLYKVVRIKKIYNYYGMVEQTGSILLECNKGYLHSSIYSDVIIRNNDFSICNTKQKGLVQLLSILPISYPGHTILSEDIGELIGEDNCKCGLKGKYFKIYGRLKNAEIRGSSDAYE